MSPVRVVPALDELEDGHFRFGLGAEASPVEKLALERGEEALAERVVVRVAYTLPIDGRTPASRQRLPNATDVYWHPWSE